MPIYFPKSENSSDITAGDISKKLTPGIEIASTFSISIAAGGTPQNSHFTTERWLINSDAWESGGTMTCRLRVTAASNMRVRCMIRRFGPTGALLQSGTFTAFQTANAGVTNVYTPTVPTWTSSEENCGNRLSIRFNFDASQGAFPASCTVEVGVADSEINTTITENNGNCRRINIA